MRLPLLAAGTALLLCTTAAMAQNNAPNTPTASPSASTANTGTTSTTPLRDIIRGMLQRSGFSDIRIMPSSFMIGAKDQQGNPVMMSVSPGSVTEVSELGTSSGTGLADNSAATSGASGSQFVAVDQNEKLSSNFVGLNVYNASNQNIGQIKDIAVGPAGRARAYIVSVGGFLGMGTHYVAMNPWAVQVSYNTSDRKWHTTTNATSDQLKSAPAFQYTGRWDASKS